MYGLYVHTPSTDRAGFLGRVFNDWYKKGTAIVLDGWNLLLRFELGFTSPSGHDLNEQVWMGLKNATYTSNADDVDLLKKVGCV